VLDLCAGHGTKAAHLAELMGNEGEIWAVELKQEKLAALMLETKRLKIGIIHPCQADATRELPAPLPDLYDRILVDAPCSGVGTIGRNPEIKWRLDPGRQDRYSEQQLALLMNASRYLKRGGRLLYSTCSFFPEENEEVVRRFLAQREDFRVLPLPDSPFTVSGEKDPFFRTYPPGRLGGSFFFAALLGHR
jgi:16S rRNA (cytosine967-C5)-methyltransferase